MELIAGLLVFEAIWTVGQVSAQPLLSAADTENMAQSPVGILNVSLEVQVITGLFLIALAFFALRLGKAYMRPRQSARTAPQEARSTQRPEATLQLSRVGHWSYDFETQELLWDKTVRDIHDVDENLNINIDTVLGFHTFESRILFKKEVMSAIIKRESFDFVIELISAKGNHIWGRAIGDCRMENGSVVGLQGVFHDITEYKCHADTLRVTSDRLQDALADRDAAEKRFFDIAAISGEWFWEQDAEGRFTFLSESYQRRTGGDPSIFIGKTRAEILASRPVIDDGVDWSLLEDRIANKQPFSDFVYRNIGVSGDIISWVRISGAPFCDGNGNFAGYRGVGSDVTDIYEARRRAEEASASKSRFLANMSHEIRTPLHGILGLAEELERSISDPDASLLIKNIRSSGDQLRNVINDILDFSKVEAGKIDIEKAPFICGDLIERIRALHAFEADEKGLSLRITTEGDMAAPRLGDAHRITQVLHNVVGNAIKFTHQGEVHVFLDARDHSSLSIKVRDSGIGMSESALERVFVGFDQGDDTTSRRYGGTGLGMPIARSLSRAMGGNLRIESLPGEGTTVYLSVPLPVTAKEPEAPSPAAEKPLESLKVLAVDDNATNRMLFELLLKRSGFTVRIAESGPEAIAAVERDVFDLYLMDISMPEMDGIEALSKMREVEKSKGRAQVPALAVTANAMRHQVQEYLDMGFDGHVAKPIEQDVLLEKIAECMEAAKAGEPPVRALDHSSADLQ